jgi:hypothetical protein
MKKQTKLTKELEDARARTDTRRLDFLERHIVNVRVPLVHGSNNLFWASPEDQEGEAALPSDLRKKIDIAMEEV